MNDRSIYISILFLIAILAQVNLSSQESFQPLNLEDTSNSNTLDTNIIHLVHADTSLWQMFDDSTIQEYNGNVIIYSDSTFMYCDSAYIKDSVFMEAFGNIVIVQGDSVQIFADTLVYSGESKQAQLFGDVILASGEQKLYTNFLDYNLKTKVANYFTESTLTDDETYLTSIRGTYFVEDDLALFKDSVRVVAEDFDLKADSLEYQTKIKTVYFLGPTVINQDERKIYCESGSYDMINELSTFSDNAQFEDEKSYAEAAVIQYDRKSRIIDMQGDAFYQEEGREVTGEHIQFDEINELLHVKGDGSIIDSLRSVYSDDLFYDVKNDSFAVLSRGVFYNEDQKLESDQFMFNDESGIGRAWGNVYWVDTTNQAGIVCDSMIFSDLDGKVTGLGTKRRPVLWTLIDGDSMFVRADTLVMKEEAGTIDTTRMMFAYHDVKIFKSDLQGIGDSLAYNAADSMFTLFGSPMLWSDTSQFSADTIDIYLKENKLDNIALSQNGFIINSPDEIYFNQIKGRNINAYFKEDNLYLMKINGNAETVYYVLDDQNAYVGVNKSTCSNIKIHFGNNQVESIISYKDIDSTLYPMEETDHSALILEGYNWEISKRPTDKNDVSRKVSLE